MSLVQLDVENVRNIQHAFLVPHPSLNLIFGKNGSGKTSLLEAIYLLARGRSFRSSRLAHVVRQSSDGLRVVAQISEAEHQIALGLEYWDKKLAIRAAGQAVQQASVLAQHLRLLLITPQSALIFQKEPKQRRRLIDWGLFHVEHQYLPVYRRWQRALDQRNAALRSHADAKALDLWDRSLVEAATELENLRKAYVERLAPVCLTFARRFSGLSEGLALNYRCGWGEVQSYADVLRAERDTDLRQGFTRAGPQRTDITMRMAGKNVVEYASGGQLKLLAISLYLAQLALMQSQAEKQCIVLVDDLPAELDEIHRNELMAMLTGLNSQLFLTSSDAHFVGCFQNIEHTLFHVEHGNIVASDVVLSR